MRLYFSRTLPSLGLLCIASSALAASHTVLVGGEYAYFGPSSLTINVGDTVTFTNIGGPHNVHADDNSFRCAVGCDGTGGNGDPSSSHWQDTITFSQAGDVHYRCDPHAPVMTGVIHVVEAGGTPTNVPITSGFSGAWYDPTQSGHGILVEVLPNNQFLAFWFTFNPNGTQQAWFGNVGAIDSTTNTATVEALQTQGGAWIPHFDPSHVTQPEWGTLVFTFTDCNHGRVDFVGTESTADGTWGTGSMNLTRLTEPAGLSCP
jgi:plastocyanin